MTSRPYFFLLLSMLIACTGSKPTQQAIPQQSITSVSPQTDGPHPALLVKLPGDTASQPIRVSKLKVDVQVVGMLATTTMEITFFNPHDRILEGQVYIPLGEGQRMSQFALEIEGKMREGVVVEKAKGQQVFEKIVRQNIDPGLLEWSKGNVFKARVFPIPANGTKRIRFAYEQALPYKDDGLQYLLPMNFRDTVDEFDLRIELIQQSLSPILHDNQFNTLDFESVRNSWIAEKQLRNFLPNQQIGLLIPHPEDSQRIFIEETGPESAFFYLNIPVERVDREKVKPSKLTILWDISASAQNRDQSYELTLLDAYLQWLGKAEVRVLGFHLMASELGTFQIDGGEWSELKETLQSQSHDGATQLGSLDLKQYRCDEYLLFSDGLSTMGTTEIGLGDAPIYAINSAQEADISYLQYLAEVSGGQLINTLSLTQSASLARLQQLPFQFISASVLRGNLTETYPSLPEIVGDDFSFMGKLHSDEAMIELNFGIGADILHQERISLSKLTDMGGGGKVERIWAQKKLAELDRRYEQNETEITRLGKKYGIVTRNTSLIVLDRIEDYVENEIVPPDELRAEYDALVEQQDKTKQFELMTQLDLVAEAFAQRKAWWEMAFEIPEGKFKPDPVKKDAEREGEYDDSDGAADFGSDEEMEESSSLSDLELFDTREAPEPSVEAKASPAKPQALAGSISLTAWNPETPYLTAIKAAAANARFSTYQQLKAEYALSPAFYLDVSDYFRQQGDSTVALRILSNIAELELENHELLRILGHRLVQLGELELAISVFEDVLAMREGEPQSYRDLGHALARKGETQAAIEMLYKVVEGTWDSRFGDIGSIVAHEINALIGQCACASTLDLNFMDDRLMAQMPTDLRVVLNWDSDNVDMDLWVTDPRGEKCYYQHKRTAIGGFISDDLTRGYGPEEFWLKKAMPGSYQIQVNYYGSSQQRLSGPTTIQAELLFDYGRESQTRKEITLRLGSESDVIDVGEFEVD